MRPIFSPAHALVKTICMVRLRISAQKLVLISWRVAGTYVSVSDRRVSHAFLMRLTTGLILTLYRSFRASATQAIHFKAN